MKGLNFSKNPHFQLIALFVLGMAAIILVHDFVAQDPELSLRWSGIIGGTLLLCLAVSAHIYLLVGKYQRNQWDRKLTWSINIIKLLSLLILAGMVIATYVAFMASGYQIGGLLVPWMEILIVMLSIIPIPLTIYWAMVNLQQTFRKRYAWVALYTLLIPLAIVLSFAYTENWLQQIYLWLVDYLNL